MIFEPLIKNPKRITVVMRTGFGDTLVYVPALQVLRKMYPDAMISYMCPENALGLYKQFNMADRYFLLQYACEESEFIKELNGEGLTYLTKEEYAAQEGTPIPFKHDTLQEGWGPTDLVIMTERNRQYIKLALKSKCKQVLTYCYARALHTKRLPFVRFFSRDAQHEIFSLQFLLKILDKKLYQQVFNQIDLSQSILKASPESRAFINKYLTECGYLTKEADPYTGFVPKQRPAPDTNPNTQQNTQPPPTGARVYKDLIVINPDSLAATRKGYSYTPENYMELAKSLAHEFPNILFVISSYGQQSYHSMELNEPNLKLFINPGDITNVIALLEQCDLIIAPSTGPAHIADNLSRDVLGAFPYYDKKRWVATGFMQLAAKQPKPSLKPHDFVMHSIDHKVADDANNKFADFKAMCRDYIAKRFTT